MLILSAGFNLPATLQLLAESTIGGAEGPTYRPSSQALSLAGALLAALRELLAGAGAGWLLARTLHGRGLHWSWAALLALSIALLGALGGAPALAWIPLLGFLGCLIAAVCAWRLTWRWHVAECDPLGAARGTPPRRLDPLALLRWPRGATGQSANGRWRFPPRTCGGERDERRAGEGLIAIGHELSSGRQARIPARHTLVLGATGSGKTVTLRRILQGACRQMGVVAVDGKGDSQLRLDLERFAAEGARSMHIWSPTGETTYNPFAHGHETELVDKALAAESFGDSYYLRIGQRFLGFAVRALQAADQPVTIAALARYADPVNLEQLAPAIEARRPGFWAELEGALPRLSAAERQAIAGTQHRLAAIAESDVGALLEPAPATPAIDLLQAVRRGDVVYFDLQADARPELARMLGAALLLDLLSIAADLQQSPSGEGAALLLDDVQAFAAEAAMRALASLFARARSAGMMLLLGTQSLADLRVAGQERALEQILDNRTTLIAHRLPGHDSALRVSRELGTHLEGQIAERYRRRAGLWRSQEEGTMRPVEMANVSAEQLRQLPTGTAVVGSLAGPPTLVRVLPPS